MDDEDAWRQLPWHTWKNVVLSVAFPIHPNDLTRLWTEKFSILFFSQKMLFCILFRYVFIVRERDICYADRRSVVLVVATDAAIILYDNNNVLCSPTRSDVRMPPVEYEWDNACTRNTPVLSADRVIIRYAVTFRNLTIDVKISYD